MLAVSDLSYVFSGNHVRALDGIGLELAPGRIHALLGENGAGKSTLARICCGHVAGWQGRMSLDHRPWHPGSPREALRQGVALVPQHPQLDRDLDVGRNLFLGHGFDRHLIYDKALRRHLAERLAAWEINLDINEAAANLDSARIHWTAIAEALLASPRWLFLDEPSAAYPEAEVDRLYGLLRRCARQGMGVVVITHRLKEVELFADHCHVLKAGRLVRSVALDCPEARQSVPELLFGSDPVVPVLPAFSHLPETAPAVPAGSPADQPAVNPLPAGLDIRHLGLNTGKKRTAQVNLRIEPGRIQGILGHWDQGLEQLEDHLAGILPFPPGSISLDGQALDRLDPRRKGYIPSRRFQRGIGLGLSIRDTVLLRLRHDRRRLKAELRSGELRRQVPLDASRDWLAPVETLSGGMIQQLLICRETMLPPPDFLLCAEPWWGLDLRAQQQLARRLRELCTPRRTILVLSSDIDEIMQLCSHALVLQPHGPGANLETATTPRTTWERLLFQPDLEVVA